MGGVVLTQREPALVTPFWVRIATETSLSPGWLLIAFPAVLYPTYLLLEVLFGRGLAAATDFGSDYEVSSAPVFIMVLSYTSMMGTYLARGTIRDLKALRPALQGDDAAYAELRGQLTQFGRRRLWIGGLVGFAIGCVLAELAVGRWTRLLAGEWSLRDPTVTAVVLTVWIVAGRMAVYLIDTARLYSRIGERHVAVDLLDLKPSSPLTRHGLRIVLLVTIFNAVVVIFWIVQSVFTPSAPMVAVWVGCVWNLVVAAAVFVLPVRGLRRQIRARKAEELSRVREKIRQNRELADGTGPESGTAGAKLPGLLAYMNQIESVREWPFDAPTLTRFFLYVAIPLGSWVGGALVERLLGAALD